MANESRVHNTRAAGALRLGVDATSAARPRTGIGHYTGALLEALARRQEVELLPFTHGLRSRLPIDALRAPARLRLPGKLVLLGWHHLRRPSVDRLVPEADVLFSPNYLALPTKKPLLITVHDLFFLQGPGQDWWSGKFLAAHLERHLVRCAALVLADSEAVRGRLLERFPGLQGRAEVLYPALRERFRSRAPAERTSAVRRELGVPEEYLLCIGELSARKNQLVLLDALRRGRMGGLPPLLFCGLSELSRAQILGRARELDLPPGQVLTLSYLEDAALHALLSGALGLICPSLDEGFGLTAAEALSIGVPVACSGVESLREVTGGLALYFDPHDAEAAADAMERLVSETETRRAQSASGPAWTRRYAVDASAQRLCELAREVWRAGRP
jgi:glycosyltransferase involved in cell wall biosynthesis